MNEGFDENSDFDSYYKTANLYSHIDLNKTKWTLVYNAD